MRTNGIQGVTHDDNQRSRNFVIDLVSKHALINNATPNFQKAFKNVQISQMVESILKDGLGLEIPFNVQDTVGLHGSDYQPLIMTQRSPIAHVLDLARLALSGQSADGFLLFSGIGEDGEEALNFRSIHDLIEADSVATITNFTNFELNSSLSKSMMNNVIEMWLPQQTSAMEKGSSFSQGSTMYDIQKGSAEVVSLPIGRAMQESISGTSLNPGNLSGFVNQSFNGLPSTSDVVLEDSRRPLSNLARTAPLTKALFSDMTQNSLTVKIPGNSNLKVGDIIDFDYRENTDMFPNKDTKFSGKNLIAGVTHYLGPLSDSPRYVTYLDLVNIQTKNGSIS